jgi:prepilin-type N-terminal cleavage/methylation domain-containing protein
MEVMNRPSRNATGFTIVELLIVVVVIAILAAITIVSYNGITNRAKESAAQSNAAQMGIKVAQLAITNNDLFPTDKAAFLTGIGVPEADAASYEYIVSADQKNFCASAVKQGVSYGYTSTTVTPIKGKCVTNLMANPSAVGAPAPYFSLAGGSYAASTRAIASDRFHTGPTSLRNIVTGSGQLSVMGRPASPFLVQAGETLSWSYWVYSSKATNATDLAEGARPVGSAYINSGPQTISIPANSWTKFSRTWQATEDINVSQVGFYNIQVVSGDTLWFDDLTVQRGSTLYKFADGTGNGFWNGVPNESSSVNIVEAE